jgi:diketogulonate reductase-like aldo/keto reductase
MIPHDVWRALTIWIVLTSVLLPSYSHIGISNWYVSDIEEVLKSNPKHHIEINQMEYHPAIAATPKYKKLLALSKKEQIVFMTYASLAPLTKLGEQSGPLLSVLDKIAAKEEGWNKGIVLQKWASQHAATNSDAIITSTSNKESRMKEYLSTFTSRKLTDDEVDEITKAGEKCEPKKIYMVPVYEGAN